MYKIYCKDINDIEMSKETLSRLSPARRSRLKSLSHEEDQKRCCAAGLLLWEHVYHGHPENYDIIFQGCGKPAVLAMGSAEPAPFYNISHSGRLAVLAVDDFPIGCDIEYSGRHIGFMDDIVKHVFHPHEAKLFLSSTGEACGLDGLCAPSEFDTIYKKILFLRYWTAKEAFFKATGDGLTKECRDYDLSGGRITDGGITWQLEVEHLEDYPDYVLTVCHQAYQ